MATDNRKPKPDAADAMRTGLEQSPGGAARRRFPIVGIGASAGGLDALRTLFQAMPADTGMGFVVTQHLDAGHPSLLAELLAKFTPMQVRQVGNGMSVEPNCIYVIPPNTYMTISDGVLLLKPPSDARGMRMPIDRFLSSLVEDQREQSIGIILSGTGTDGTQGIREVKANGGMVIVQDPETAQYDGMPRSAIATGQADAVLSLERMPGVLVNYSRHAYITHGAPDIKSVDTGYDPLTAILSLLLAKTGHDFRCYKKGTLVRRIHRRMGITGVERFEKYLDVLRERDEEVRLLSKDLFIGVTSFFRESDAWLAVIAHVVGPIVAGHPGGDPVRVWVPGCATGEEAYTLAMLFVEAFEQEQKNINLLVFATDVDTDALQIARAGYYQENIMESISPERLSRFFSREGDRYRVNKSLRDLVLFTPQNLIADPPFSKLDLVSCRNLLIYLETRLQEKVLRLFHFALRPDGFLLLGSSESLGGQQREFRTLSKKWRIFKPEGPSQLGMMEVPVSREAQSSVPRFLARGLSRREPSLADMAQQALVETFAPASVLVTRRYQTLYVYGDTSDYLSHPPGELTDDLISLTRSELRMKTRSALHQAMGENRQVIVRGARIRHGETVLPVVVTATPLRQPPLVAGLLLVSFHLGQEEPLQLPISDLGQGQEAQIVHQLEDELKSIREELQSTIEELETSNEELKASNEEVMSMNEELQSSNEELETSKEELQSLNEELTTVNNQLHNKVVEVEGTNNDLNNLLSSSNIATLFLDRDLRIKRFTPATVRVMNLIPGDVGRPVADIAHKCANDNLPGDCRKVLEDLQPVERELLGDAGEWYIRRVQAYRTADNRIDGTVVTFSDVTAIKRRDEEHAKLASIVDSSENPIIGMTLEGIITSWNPGAETTFGYPADEMVGKSLDPLFQGRSPSEALRILREVGAGRRVGPYETVGRSRDNGRIQLSVSISPIHDAAGRVIGASTIARDITERKQAEAALRDRVKLQDQLAGLAATVPGMLASYRLCADGSACLPYASPAIEDLFGLKPADVTEDYGPIRDRIHPDDQGSVQEAICESGRTLTPWRCTFRFRHPTKGEIWVEGHSMPSREPDGSTLWHGYLQDITKRKRAEQALADADRRKNEFLAILGHELRNPLAPIRNAVHVLSQSDASPDKAQWAIDLIGRQSAQLEQLVNDLLNVARLSGLRVQLGISRMVIQDALEDALLGTESLVAQCKQHLESRLPENPIAVEGDHLRLAQVFTNLLRNAAKYTPGGGHIWVTLNQEGQNAVVRVRDDGIGIRPEYMPYLFDFFSRGEVEHPNIKDADGLGVGLALSRQLIQKHGGTLEGHSGGPGQGSEFVVTLPVCSPVTSTTPLLGQETDAELHQPRRRVLVVDDNLDVADSFRVLLETMGHRVRVLNVGAEVVATVRVFQPDVVFLDIAMPDMDGYQVATALRASEVDPQPLLVAVTGYGEDGNRKAALEAGFDRHLIKPPNPEQIAALLAELDEN